MKKLKKFSKKTGSDRQSNMIETSGAAGIIVDYIVIILCGIVALCSFVPMWHVLMSSISDGKTLMGYKGIVWLPVGKVTFDGYRHIFRDASILKGYLNSVLYTAGSTLIGFFIASTGGYALSRNTKLKVPMILFVMVTMFFSGGMVPTYIIVRKLGWVGTPLPMLFLGCTNAMFIILMMNAFNTISKEYFEAARIDGAGHFRTMFQIMLPQAMNTGFVIILNSVVAQWNSWLTASIYVPNKRSLWPLQLWIKQITADTENFLRTMNPDYSRYLIQFTVIVAASLPIIVMVPFFQDKLEQGVIGGGIKG